MLKKIFFILTIFILLFSCKTISVKNKETTAKMLFKNLVKESEKVSDISVSGLFSISGAKEIPPVFIQFDTFGNLKGNDFTFKISFLKKPLMEVVVNKDDVLFINHTGKQYIRLKLQDVDFSKFIGINFNPSDVGYLFLGKLPYSEKMEIMDLSWTPHEYVLTVTNTISKYTIHLNSNEEIIKAKINGEYFDPLILESIQYAKNDDKENIPKTLVFSTEDNLIKMTFMIEKMSLKPSSHVDTNLDILKNYTEVFDINKIKVQIK
jgi:hypothetical protein